MLSHLFSLSLLACLTYASPISTPLHVSALNPIMTDYFSSINARRHSPTMKAAMKALKAGSPVTEATCKDYDLSSAVMPMVSGLPGPSVCQTLVHSPTQPRTKLLTGKFEGRSETISRRSRTRSPELHLRQCNSNADPERRGGNAVQHLLRSCNGLDGSQQSDSIHGPRRLRVPGDLIGPTASVQ